MTSSEDAALLARGQSVLREEAAALELMAQTLDGPFVDAVKILLACKGRVIVSAEAGLPVHGYLPMHVKQAVTGYGHAEKAQVERMVGHLVTLAGAPGSSHAADAIASARGTSGTWCSTIML